MADLDVLAPNYRRAQQRWPSAPTLAKGYEALSACFSGSNHGMVEHVKSYVESVCLTIMGELREPMPSSRPSTTDLLVAALSALGLRNTRGASKLDKVLSAFNRLAEALSEMRDNDGAVAHGKDGFLDPVTADHARAFLHTGDAILGVLLSALEGKQPDLTVTREPYEGFPHLNDRIDRAVRLEARIDEDGDRPILLLSLVTGTSTEAIELRVEPSRLLYGIDREAYIEMLETAELADTETEEEVEGVDVSETVDVSRIEVSAAAGPIIELVRNYTGALNVFQTGLDAFLAAEGVSPAVTSADGPQIIESLLATAEQNMGLDWKNREPVQARLKVACKRVLIHFGSTPDKADEVSERLVGWLRVQVGDVGDAHAGFLGIEEAVDS